jgi:hypothetical protein
MWSLWMLASCPTHHITGRSPLRNQTANFLGKPSSLTAGGACRILGCVGLPGWIVRVAMKLKASYEGPCATEHSVELAPAQWLCRWKVKVFSIYAAPFREVCAGVPQKCACKKRARGGQGDEEAQVALRSA